MSQQDINNAKTIPQVLYKYMGIKRFMNSFNDYLAGKLWFAERKSLIRYMVSLRGESRGGVRRF
jgi:hypothetical protein